ncbi:MAG: DUF2752 domain-containing protein [Chitinophagaceae bacterium]
MPGTKSHIYHKRTVWLKYTEPAIWFIVLLVLFCIDTSQPSFSFCIFKLAGFNSCWGCGIGRAIHDALHGNFQQSWQHHVMGIPATIGIIYLIIKPLTPNKTTLL